MFLSENDTHRWIRGSTYASSIQLQVATSHLTALLQFHRFRFSTRMNRWFRPAGRKTVSTFHVGNRAPVADSDLLPIVASLAANPSSRTNRSHHHAGRTRTWWHKHDMAARHALRSALVKKKNRPRTRERGRDGLSPIVHPVHADRCRQRYVLYVQRPMVVVSNGTEKFSR